MELLEAKDGLRRAHREPDSRASHAELREAVDEKNVGGVDEVAQAGPRHGGERESVCFVEDQRRVAIMSVRGQLQDVSCGPDLAGGIVRAGKERGSGAGPVRGTRTKSGA